MATPDASSTLPPAMTTPELSPRRRVKLYTLNDSRVWDDQGTGHVTSRMTPDLSTPRHDSRNDVTDVSARPAIVEGSSGIDAACDQEDGEGGHVTDDEASATNCSRLSLIVHSEIQRKVLLDVNVLLDTAYQKQQETLIVWTEGERDYALSFQDKAGCDEIWGLICEVQGKDSSVEVTQEVIGQGEEDDMDDLEGGDESLVGGADSPPEGVRGAQALPPCEPESLDRIAELFASALRTPVKREKLTIQIENEGYVRSLVALFHRCESARDTGALHRLHAVARSLFLLNKTAIFELLFADDVIFDVIGMLEHDPALARPASHREYLTNQARLKEAIPLDNAELVHKIHQTYRVQYIQDVILPATTGAPPAPPGCPPGGSFEGDNLLSTLSSFIFFNKMEIVTIIQEDEKLLQTVVSQLADADTPVSKRRDLIHFLREFCSFSQTLAQQNRDSFFKTLSELGVMNMLQSALSSKDAELKSTAVDIFGAIVEYNPSVARDFMLRDAQKRDDDELILNLVIGQMTTDTDAELSGALQVVGIVRLLIDPENMVSILKTEKAEFLRFFYAHCARALTAPLFSNTADGTLAQDDYETAQLLSLVVELLTFCVEHHTYHMKTFIINENLFQRILVLLRSRHSFLALAALRFLRRTIGLKDEFYHRYIVKGDLLRPVVEAFRANGTRYNLLNSAVIELFEFIRTEDIKSLTTYVLERHMTALEPITYVRTFSALKQAVHPPAAPHSTAQPPATPLNAVQPITVTPRMGLLAGVTSTATSVPFPADMAPVNSVSASVTSATTSVTLATTYTTSGPTTVTSATTSFTSAPAPVTSVSCSVTMVSSLLTSKTSSVTSAQDVKSAPCSVTSVPCPQTPVTPDAVESDAIPSDATLPEEAPHAVTLSADSTLQEAAILSASTLSDNQTLSSDPAPINDLAPANSPAPVSVLSLNTDDSGCSCSLAIGSSFEFNSSSDCVTLSSYKPMNVLESPCCQSSVNPASSCSISNSSGAVTCQSIVGSASAARELIPELGTAECQSSSGPASTSHQAISCNVSSFSLQSKVCSSSSHCSGFSHSHLSFRKSPGPVGTMSPVGGATAPFSPFSPGSPFGLISLPPLISPIHSPLGLYGPGPLVLSPNSLGRGPLSQSPSLSSGLSTGLSPGLPLGLSPGSELTTGDCFVTKLNLPGSSKADTKRERAESEGGCAEGESKSRNKNTENDDDEEEGGTPAKLRRFDK